MSRKSLAVGAALVAALALVAAPAVAHQQVPPLSGAIFTTDSTGVPVNLNHYAAKEDVYLNGGPGINAPADAAGLPPGDYYFQVTDPPGKQLLSTDNVFCRGVHVDASGLFTSAFANAGCDGAVHQTVPNSPDGGVAVQLFPYDDTPNNGGVYKVWLTPVNQWDLSAQGNKFGFVPHHSKTDNYKVKSGPVIEIDTRFWKPGQSQPVDGLGVTWTDTVGASNIKYSEYAPNRLAFHEAHVEAAEQGNHTILVQDQPGCTIDHVVTPTGRTLLPSGGSVTVPVSVKNPNLGDATYFVDVYCTS